MIMLIITAGSKKSHYYDEVEICVSPTDKKSEDGSSTLSTTKPHTIFEALYTETTLISDSSNDTQNNSIPPVFSSEGEHNYYNGGVHNSDSGERNGTTSEGTISEVTYDVPQATDSVENDNANYSSLGPIDYSTLQPHIPNPVKPQHPPTDDQYSCLHHP